ncbi:hypothetical protein UlMin_002657 [Ulmus minor]
MEPKSPSKLNLSIMGFSQFKGWFKMSIIFVVVVLLFLGAHLGFQLGKGGVVSKGSYFSVVVNCGSTGTRVNVYEWVGISRNERDLPILLHSYPDNLTKSSLWKRSCKYHCMQTEPGLYKFVGNSSGVRLSLEPLISWAELIVPLERHSSTPIFVLVDVEVAVKEHLFSYRKSWIRVLSGKEEAYYGWVALNYKGRFMNHSRLPTLGLLDLGGSSLQVVMEVDGVKEDTHYVRSKLGFIEHHILAYSLPAFGLNKAFDRTVVLLSHTEALRDSSGGTLELRHPCFGFDFVHNYTCSEKCKSNAKTEYPCFYLVGVPNWDKCKILARAAPTNSSSLDWSWLTAAENYKAKLCLDRGQHLCSRSWTNSQNDCFRVPYMASVIEEALYVSWTLGATLVEGENIWLDAATSRIINLTPLKIISSPIFVLLLCVLSIFHCSQVRLPMLGKKSVASGASSLPYIHPKPRPN